MPPRIAIPLPHSTDLEYAERAIPQYECAVELAGGEPVRIPLDQTAAEVTRMISRCNGVLLPGSKADVDPVTFRATRSAHTAPADVARSAVDNLLLEHAYRLRKPVLGICYGLQSLNVFRAGSLVQHIPDFLPEELRARVNHEAGRTAAIAHDVAIEAGSRLSEILCGEILCGDSRPRLSGRAQLGGGLAQTSATSTPPENRERPGHKLILPVNSSHHQSADTIGEGLRIVARCTADGIIEALEGTSPDHFVLAVQWHPERSVELDEPSRGIFRAFVEAANGA